MKMRYGRRTALTAMALLLAVALVMPTAVMAAQPTVLLRTTESFAVLAGSAITNTGATTIFGDIGISPGLAITGAGSITQTGGAYHVDDGLAKSAKNDLVTAYNDAAGRTPVTTIGTELGGQTLLPGVYASDSGTFEITGTLTLNARGNPDAVFIFLMDSTLVTATRSVVSFINGARYCRVFWKVGSSATLGEYSTFRGHIFALTSITANTGAFIEGQLLARNGAVTLQNNRIINGFCASATSPYGPEAGYWSNGVWYPTNGSPTNGSPTNGSPTRLPATGDDTSGITTLGIVAIFAGIAFVLAGVYVYTDRQRKKRS